MQDGTALITVDCEKFDTEKVFQERLESITETFNQIMIWQSQITNCNTFKIGGIVVMKKIADINTTNSRSTSQVNLPF